MSRDISSTTVAELSKEVIAPFFAVDLDFDSAPLYLWSGYGDLVIDDKTYLGAGQFLDISSIAETTEMEAKGASITMSGIPSSFLSLALQEPYQGRECRIYFGVVLGSKGILQESGSFLLLEDGGLFLTEDSGVNLTEIFSGELDQMNIEENVDSAIITVTAENVLIKLGRPIVRRFTNEDQKSRFPNDIGLEYIASLQEKEIFWGKAPK
jgi:hypothetical protein